MIYIDPDYICHLDSGDGRRGVTIADLDGKCRFFVEHHRYVPEGETWTREDGVAFTGEMLTPTIDVRILLAAQVAHDEMIESENISLELLADHEYRLCMMELGL